MSQQNEPEVIEGKPPNKAGPYHNYGLKWFIDRHAVPEFIKKQGYSRGYTYTDNQGDRILTLCERDLIKE